MQWHWGFGQIARKLPALDQATLIAERTVAMVGQIVKLPQGLELSPQRAKLKLISA